MLELWIPLINALLLLSTSVKNIIGEILKPSEEPEEAKIYRFQCERELFLLLHCIPCT